MLAREEVSQWRGGQTVDRLLNILIFQTAATEVTAEREERAEPEGTEGGVETPGRTEATLGTAGRAGR